jgi:hypothetical protein
LSQVRDLIEDAYRKIGVVAEDEPMTADQAKTGLREFNRMLRSWQNFGHNLWIEESYGFNLTTAASYTLTLRPMRISSIRFKQDDQETPIALVTRQEYDDLPDKTATGLPSMVHFSRLQSTAKIYVWPVLATASGERIQFTYEREFEETDDLSDGPDAPVEWDNAIVYSLAVLLAPNHAKEPPLDMAAAFLQQALAADREGSVFLFGDCE